MLVGGIVVGVACAMYAAAVMDMEDVEMEREKKLNKQSGYIKPQHIANFQNIITDKC